MYTNRGWLVSRDARQHPAIYSAIMSVAHTELAMPDCIGARMGFGVREAPGMPMTTYLHIMFWRADELENLYTYEVDGEDYLHCKEIFGPRWDITVWIQFLTVSSHTKEDIIEQTEVETPSAGPPVPEARPLQGDVEMPNDDEPADDQAMPPRPPPVATSDPRPRRSVATVVSRCKKS